jgi:hypothetical protein
MSRSEREDRASVAATDILEIVTHALTSWLDHEPADLAGARTAIEQRLRAEIEATGTFVPVERALPPMCDDCGVNRSDPPSKLCAGCEAYRDHTQ